MAFVYNNKLPFYSWGVLDVRGSTVTDNLNNGVNTGTSYQVNDAWGNLVVPLPEDGEQKLWNARVDISGTATLANRLALSTATPCDAQLPWKSFSGCMRTQNMPFANRRESMYGLTIHGELYQINPRDERWLRLGNRFANIQRRMARVTSKDISSPFASLHTSDQRRSGNNSYDVSAVTRDGKAWQVGHTQGSGPFAVQAVALPSEETAKGFWFFHANNGVSLFVLTTNSEKTYLRKSSSSKWYCLTGGCVGTESFVISSQQWTYPNLPAFEVSAPPEGGTRAKVEVLWAFTSGNFCRPVGVCITDPGSGYTESPTVTTSVTPTRNPTAAPAEIKLRVFAGYAVEAYAAWAVPLVSRSPQANGAILDASGSVWGVKIPELLENNIGFLHNPPPFPDSTSGSGDWAFDVTPKTAGASPQKLAVRQYVNSTLASTFSGRFVITKDDKLYDNGSLLDEGPWACVAQNYGVVCGVKRDGTMWSWGATGETIQGHCSGDETALNTIRSSPTQIAAAAEWVSVFAASGGFVAIRKDAICRDIDQPMEYWPDWYFQQQTT